MTYVGFRQLCFDTCLEVWGLGCSLLSLVCTDKLRPARRAAHMQHMRLVRRVAHMRVTQVQLLCTYEMHNSGGRRRDAYHGWECPNGGFFMFLAFRFEMGGAWLR